MAGITRKYRREYRREHADEINAQLRKRRETDPEYAERIRQYGRNYWRRRCDGHVPKPYPIHINGERLYRTSEAARLLHCAEATISGWHRKGYVPLPLVVDGRRLYRREQIDLMGRMLEMKPNDHKAKAAASKFVCENWHEVAQSPMHSL